MQWTVLLLALSMRAPALLIPRGLITNHPLSSIRASASQTSVAHHRALSRRNKRRIDVRLTFGDNNLPPEIRPIVFGVFSQMLGEGIAMSSLAFYLTRLGAQPLTVGAAISAFSVSQMTFAPIMVRLSTRFGCSTVLRLCLSGAAASSLLIALSGSVYGVVAGRALAGVFAACVPVAQSGVTDILPREQAALGLSRVAAASQLGVVVGPAVSAVFQAAFAAAGLPTALCLPAVFVLAAAFSLSVLVQMTLFDRRLASVAPLSRELDAALDTPPKANATLPPTAAAAEATADGGVRTLRLAQPMLRSITIIIGWTAVLSNSVYGLFAPRFMGFPRLVAKIGEHRACVLGILATGAGIGGQSLLRVQPLHSLLYMVNRMGAGVADTATAALVARSSADRESRSRNLALLTSTRAAARIASPLVSTKMYALSCGSAIAPGALPFVTAGCLATAIAPLPLLLLRAEQRDEKAHAT